MNLKATLFAAALSLTVASPSFAAVCFKTPAQHAAVKAQLPKLLQSLPLMLGADGAITAAIKIQGAGALLKIEGYSLVAGNPGKQSQKIQNVCVEGSTLQASFESETMDFVIAGDKVLYQGFEFKKLSAGQFNALAKRVTDAMRKN